MDPREPYQNTNSPNNATIMTGNLEDEFNRPVESIMRCDDFKSNFARRLSNRYRRPVVAPRLESPLSLKPLQNTEEIIETIPTPPKSPVPSILVTLNDTLKSVDSRASSPAPKPAARSSITSSVMRQANIEVETLRWQLAQTEANRQMHIALLKQIVNFLNNVKQHINQKCNGKDSRKESLPRSRSAVNVNNNNIYSLSPMKKMSAKKISKSISNVNGSKEIWNQTQMTVESAEKEDSHKISEEMSRLITLATTVLATDVPDLASSFHDTDTNCKESAFITNDTGYVERAHHTNAENANNNKHIQDLDETDVSIVSSVELLISNDGSDEASVQTHKSTESIKSSDIIKTPTSSSKSTVDSRSHFTAATFVEDESGFSSMNSFQDIGIPIINIIAPSPCKDNGYTNNFTDILEAEKWNNSNDISKQPLKVFWV